MPAFRFTMPCPMAEPPETLGSDGKGSDTIRWGRSKGLDVSDNPHVLDLTMGGSARRTRQTLDRWTVALARWVKLVKAPAFLAFVQANIARARG